MPTQAKPTEEAISHLLHDEKQLYAPENLRREARLKDFDAECQRAAEDPDAFWAEIARELHWHEPWSKVFD
ncbi:MAG TPA: acetyl-coenzyme A synthetase N-terminal domain-containing protein, partial [Candidatus Acidoferrum sp.]|nr:acetyl-coenzyme A synthetase N-terminal domain-containing protein [Candidatus Acidoferrum sp.]